MLEEWLASKDLFADRLARRLERVPVAVDSTDGRTDRRSQPMLGYLGVPARAGEGLIHRQLKERTRNGTDRTRRLCHSGRVGTRRGLWNQRFDRRPERIESIVSAV